jgi:uncharacterized membrane protein (UPF0127 family)
VVRPLLLAVTLALVGCSSDPTPEPTPATVVFADGAATLTVEIADSPTERAQGLMGVTELPEDDGMVFVWNTLEDASFWMKDTLIPLSIAFVGDDDRIHTILEMEPCESEPCRTYEAREPYVMAIEANAGWFAANGIEIGDTADLVREP